MTLKNALYIVKYQENVLDLAKMDFLSTVLRQVRQVLQLVKK